MIFFPLNNGDAYAPLAHCSDTYKCENWVTATISGFIVVADCFGWKMHYDDFVVM